MPRKLNIFVITVHRILTHDLGYYAYKVIEEPVKISLQKTDTRKLLLMFNEYSEKEIEKILVSDEKNFDTDGVSLEPVSLIIFIYS